VQGAAQSPRMFHGVLDPPALRVIAEIMVRHCGT
jgi:hypothetical protein